MDKKLIVELFNSKAFEELIINGYIDKRMKDIVFNEDLNDNNVIDELKSIKSLKFYLDTLLNDVKI
jgi:hypothetical protein